MKDLEPNIYVSTAITWAAAIAALVMRMVARRMTRMSWWWDDYCCILAFIFASLYSVTVLEWTVRWSLGQYMPDDISTERRNDILYYSRFIGFFNSLTYAFSIGFSKLAILCLYWRMFKQSAIMIPIRVMIALVVSWIILRTFMVIFRCIPVQAYWDKSIPNPKCRIKDTDFFFGTVLTHFLMDIAILILPIFQVSRLRLRIGQKITVVGLFLVGLLVCLASVGAIVEALRYDPKSTQMPHDYGMYCVWGSVELNIAIVSACCPLLRPIFRHIFPARFLSSYGSSQPISRPSHAIKLATLNKSNREREADETSSQHQLADPENGIDGGQDFDTLTDYNPKSIRTVISGPNGSFNMEDNHDMARIHVQNEMVVQVEEMEPPKRFKQ